MTPEAIAEGILLLGPGFVFWKALYLSGAQHRRPEWEWVVWSVLTSLLIAGLTTALRWAGAAYVSPAPALADGLEVASRFGLAGAGGVAAGYSWRRIKASDRRALMRFQRSIRDSAWDLVLELASRQHRDGTKYGVAVTVEATGAPDGEAAYYGKLHAFGYEAAEVEPWLYLTAVKKWSDAQGKFEPLVRTAGVMFHRDQIRRLRVVAGEVQRSPTAIDPEDGQPHEVYAGDGVIDAR